MLEETSGEKLWWQKPEFVEKDWWFVGRRKIILAILEQYLGSRSGLKILDVGCGEGDTSLSLSKFGTVYGLDFNAPFLRMAQDRGLHNVVLGSAFELPFSNEAFDVITILDVIEHLQDDVGVLQALKKVLKKGGIIFISVPAFQFLWSEHDVAISHVRRYNNKNLTKTLVKAGLKVERSTYAISLPFPLVVIYKAITRFGKSKRKAQTTHLALPGMINNLLMRVLSLESKIIGKRNLAFGVSLMSITKVSCQPVA